MKVSFKPAFGVLMLGLLPLSVPTLFAQPGTIDTNYLADVDGAVRSMALQPDGKLLIGGQFRFVNGVERYAVVRLDRDGALDGQFQAAFDWGSAEKILLQPDGRIVVGGAFQHAGASLPQLVRLEANGVLDSSFVSESSQSFWQAFASQSDGKILVVGDSGLVRLLPDGALDTNFMGFSRYQNQTNEDGSVTSANLSFSSLVVLPDQRILVGGNFDRLFGKPVSGLIRLNPDGTLDTTFRPATNWIAECLAVLPDGTVLSGGSTLYGPGAVRKFRADGQPDSSFLKDVTFNGYIHALAVQQDGKVIAAGNFNSVNGLPRGNIARLNSDGSLDLEFESSVDAQIDALALQDDGAVLVGGWFDKHLLRLLAGSSVFPGRLEFTSPVYPVNESGGSVVVPVCRYGGTNGTVTVHYETFQGTATSGADFIPQAGTLTYGPGQTSNYFVVPIVQDSLDEGYPNDERIGLSLSAPTGGAALGTLNQAIISIMDDDCTLSFAQTTFTGLEASGRVAVSIVRSGFPGSSVSAVCGTTDLSALAGLDYVGDPQVFTLAAGETNKTLWFALLRDTLSEGEEQFAVHLSQARGANIGSRSNAVVRIVDDAPGAPDPAFSAETGYSDCLGVVSGGDFFAIPFNVARFHANGKLDLDFHPPTDPIYYHRALAVQPDGKIVLSRNTPAGLLRLNPDGSLDPSFNCSVDRGVRVIRVQPDGKLLVGADYYPPGLARLNPDGTPDAGFQCGSLAGSPISALVLQPNGMILCAASFANSGTLQPQLVRLQADGSSDPNFSSGLSTDDRVLGLALQTDGKILVGAQLSLGPGTYRNGLVRLHADGALDTNFVAASFGYSDRLPLAIQAGGKILVGGYGAILRLNPDGSKDLTFDSGLGPSDGYSPLQPAAIALQPDGGVLVSGNFTWMNDIACPGLVRLQNDNQSASGEISLELRTKAVSESGGNVIVGVTRTGASNGVVLVPFSTEDGTARAGTDYTPQSGVLTFADGDTSEKFITIPILEDTLPEGDETFSINLGAPVGGAAWGKTASVTVTIVDNDVTVQLAQNQYRAYERERGLTVTVERLGQSAGEVSADYTTVDGSALAGFDYIAQTGTVVFGPGETNKTIVLPVIDDRIPEPDEIFTFQLTGVSSGARLGTNTAAVLLIVDDDHAGMPDPGFGAGADLCEGEFSGWADLYCVALQSDGRVLVGGKIPYFNGQYCSGVLRLLPDGSLDPAFVLTPSVGIEAPVVRQIRLQADGRVVLAVRQSLVPDTCLRLLTNGLPDPSFAPVELNPSYGMSGTAGSLETLLVQDDDKVLIAGSFTSVNNVPRYNLARLNSDGTLDLSFVPPPSRSPYVATESISCLALEPNGRVLVGGNFIVTNSVQCYGLARLNSDGSTDLSFDPGIGIADRNGIARPWSGLVVQALTVQADGRILVSGNFMQVNGNARTNLARLNSDGSVDLSFNPLISCGDMPGLARVWTIVLQPNNKILVGGFFFDVNGQPRYGIARLNPDGVLDASFSAGAVQFSVPTIRALALEPEGDILAVGSFYDLGGLRRCDIARLYGEPSLIPYNGQPWFMSLDRQKAGAVQLYFFAPPARPYTIEATSDFIHWLGLGPAAEVTEGYFQFEDTGPAEASRFYRVLCR